MTQTACKREEDSTIPVYGITAWILCKRHNHSVTCTICWQFVFAKVAKKPSQFLNSSVVTITAKKLQVNYYVKWTIFQVYNIFRHIWVYIFGGRWDIGYWTCCRISIWQWQWIINNVFLDGWIMQANGYAVIPSRINTVFSIETQSFFHYLFSSFPHFVAILSS